MFAYYELIYLIVVALLALNVKNAGYGINNNSNSKFVYVVALFFILFFAFRPAIGDTIAYLEDWDYVTDATYEGFDFGHANLIFDNLFNFMGAMGFPIQAFFLIIAAIYVGGMVIACQKLFPYNSLFAFITCLTAFSTYSYGTNGIKAGAAASLFLLALAYRDKLGISILLAVVSWGFHHSMQLPVAIYVITLIFKNHKWYFVAWMFCLLMAIAHVDFFQNIFAGLTDASGQDYLGDKYKNMYDYEPGFRLDFILYSAVPVIIGYFVKYKYKLEDKLYDIILNMYLACNGIWMLCMYAMFTNRIAYLSWFMYPILIIYPSLAISDVDHPLVRNRNKIFGCHFAFTIIMFIVYGIRYNYILIFK